MVAPLMTDPPPANSTTDTDTYPRLEVMVNIILNYEWIIYLMNDYTVCRTKEATQDISNIILDPVLT